MIKVWQFLHTAPRKVVCIKPPPIQLVRLKIDVKKRRHMSRKNSHAEMESLNCGEKLGSCHSSLVVHTWDMACEASKKHSSTELASSSSPQTSSSTPACRDIQFSAGLGFFDGGNGTSCSLSCRELLRDPVWCTFLGILFLLNILYKFVSCLDFCWENKINITPHCIHTTLSLLYFKKH